jgi:hypothetical protein
MNKNSSAAKRMSFFFIAVITVLLILSFFSFFQAIESFRNTGSLDYITVMLSLGAVILSLYMITQMRKKPVKLGFEPVKVFTTIQCPKCEFQNTRKFQNKDYVLKTSETCPKCNNATYISSIYRKAEEKEED